MGHGLNHDTSHAVVGCECMKCSMSPFATGLLEQVGLAEGDLPSVPQAGCGTSGGVLVGAIHPPHDAQTTHESAS